MITKRQRQRIKRILGKHYTSLILQYFEDNDIKTQNGKEYTPEYIRVIMHGRENELAEIAIYNAVQYYKLKKQHESQRRNQILNKKSEAATSD